MNARPIVTPDHTPPEMKAAIAEAERVLAAIARAFANGIPPTLNADALLGLTHKIHTTAYAQAFANTRRRGRPMRP